MQKVVNYVTLFLLIVGSVAVGLLFVEYRYYYEQVQQLQQLKQEYYRYCSSYKDQLDEDVPYDFELCSSDTESSDQQSPEEDFSVVQELENAGPLLTRDESVLQAEPEVKQIEQVVAERPIEAPKPIVRPKNLPARTPQRRQRRKLDKQIFSAAWPIERNKFWISSKFGPRKKRNGSWGFHYGLDMAAIKGTPVKAVAAGKVVEAAYSRKGYGKCIVILHANGIKTRYAHLDRIYVAVGKQINTGDLIGCVGDTGHVRGRNASHLHLEVIIKGKHIDPLYVLP